MSIGLTSIRPKVRVVIVDDHTLFREGLRTILEMEEGIEVVADAESAEDIWRDILRWYELKGEPLLPPGAARPECEP